MSLRPLKFSLGISVLVHGLVISGVLWLGQFHRAPASLANVDHTTLELIAAPASAPEQLVEAVLAATATAPPPPGPALPQPQEIPATIPLPPTETILPTPTPPAGAVTEAVSATTSVAPTTPTTAPSATTGDNSSPLPGKDFTTEKGGLTVTAKPDYRKNPEPEYPLAARRRGQQGTVVIYVTVSPAGRAIAISLKESSGFDLLDQAALRAVTNYEFEPARVGALAVESKIEVPVRFILNR